MKFITLTLLIFSQRTLVTDVRSYNTKAAAAYLQESFDQSHYPGLSYSVVNAKGILLEGGFGLEIEGQPKAMDQHSSSAIGSVTKSFTAFCVMKLVEEGKLDLDEKVVTYLPWFQTARKQESDKITLRHLLSNTSGLPSLDLDILGEDASPDSPERFVRALSAYVMNREAGIRFQYSNVGFAVAGLVASTVCGMDFPQMVAHYILNPLGMNRSTTDPADFKRMKVLHGHYAGYHKGIPVNRPLMSMNYVAAGSSLL